MTQNEKNRPLSGIFVGSFDLLTGIRLCHHKIFKELTDQQIEDVIKISLSNVHRQGQRYFEDFSVSTIEIQCYRLLIEYVIFNISPTKNKFIYYSVGLIFNSDEIRKNEHLIDMLIFWTKILGNNVRSLIQNNWKQDSSTIDYSSLEILIDRISDECAILAQSKIENLPSFDIIKPFDINFYANALTSHLQTQMTTVIEFPPCEDCEVKINQPNNSQKNKSNANNKIRSQATRTTSSGGQELIHSFQDLLFFLSHFTLPSQLELSSFKAKEYPTPGLFLQCVYAQKDPPDEFLSISPRPTTWIRLQDMKIFRTSEKYFQEQYKNAIQSNLYTANDSDSSNSNISPYLKPFWPISSRLKKDQIANKMIAQVMNSNNCSLWALSTVSIIQNSPKFVKNMTANQQFESLIRLTYAFIAIKNEILELQNENSECLTLEQINHIQKDELDSLSNDDLLIVTSIAQIYDENVYKQMQNFFSHVYK